MISGQRHYGDAALRARAVELRRQGLTMRVIATRLDVDPKTVCNWLRKAAAAEPPPTQDSAP